MYGKFDCTCIFFSFLLLTPDNVAQQIATFVIPLLVVIGWM